MAALWLIALLFALCAAHRAAAVTVRLDEKDTASTVFLHVGDRLRLELPSAPATGFGWKVKALDASHLELLSRALRPDSGRLDASGVQVFVWRALSPGSANLGIEYSRASDGKTVPPAKRIAIAVAVAAGELAPASGVAHDSVQTSAQNSAEESAEDATASGYTGFAPSVSTTSRSTTYRGVLACEGCTGIAVDLTLYASPAGPPDGLPAACLGTCFVERRRYQGAPGGDRTVAGTGRLGVVKGTYADPSLMVYALVAPDGSLENLKVSGDELIPLDGQMLPIPPAAGASAGQGFLKKVSDADKTGGSIP